MRRKFSREIYVKTLNPSSFPLQLKVFVLNRILKITYRRFFTWDITTIGQSRKRMSNKKSENRGRKAWRWWSLLPSSSLSWLCKCFTNPAYGLHLLWLYYSDLNVPRPPLSLCVPVGYPRAGTALSSSQFRLGWASSHSSHRGAKCPRVSCWSNTAFFTLSSSFNYAIIKKNSQTKMNVLLSPERFQRHFCSSFSFQSWHVLQNNSRFALLHSLTLFIKAIQTINYYFSEKLWMDWEKGKKISFVSEEIVCLHRDCKDYYLWV